jgi:hypothetical protein
MVAEWQLERGKLFEAEEPSSGASFSCAKAPSSWL